MTDTFRPGDVVRCVVPPSNLGPDDADQVPVPVRAGERYTVTEVCGEAGGTPFVRLDGGGRRLWVAARFRRVEE